MNKNDIITLKIEDMGIDGEGIGKIDGMTFFVKDAVIGDEIEARITKLKKNYGYARVEQILKSSGFRTEPKCELHRRCGGCQIQAMDYAKQLEFKENKVKNNLVRLGGFHADFVDSVTEPIVGMENPYRYRNKAQFPIGKDKDGNIIAGFYASRTHSIIPVKDCMLGVAENREILDAILSYMRECHIEPYDETTGRGLVRHALIRYGFTWLCIGINRIINRYLFAPAKTSSPDFSYSLRDSKRRKITAFKCTVADTYDRIGNDYACKASAIQKCTVTDTCDRIGNCYACKIVASLKCTVADTCNRIRYSYACKIATTFKC